jgi:hypothetical protein
MFLGLELCLFLFSPDPIGKVSHFFGKKMSGRAFGAHRRRIFTNVSRPEREARILTASARYAVAGEFAWNCERLPQTG